MLGLIRRRLGGGRPAVSPRPAVSRRAVVRTGVGLLVAGLLVPAVGGCKKDGGSAATAAGGKMTVVVGTEAQYAPFEITGADGQLQGFDIDLVKAVGEKAGFAVQFKDMGFDALIPALGSGQIQMAASAMSITDDRKKAVDFSDSYIEAGIGVAVRMNDTAIKSADDLKGKTVAVQTGTTGATMAESLKKDGKLANIKYFANAPVALMELMQGRVDAVINDRPASEAILAADPGKAKLLDQVLKSDPFGFAVRKGNAELLTKVNAALKELAADGTIEKLKTKHMKGMKTLTAAPSTAPATMMSAATMPAMTMPAMTMPAMTVPTMPVPTTAPTP